MPELVTAWGDNHLWPAQITAVTSRFPWWAGVIAALVAFIALHVLASIEVPAPTDPKQMGGMVVRQVIRSAAFIGQWLLPALFLFGAVASYFKQRRRASCTV